MFELASRALAPVVVVGVVLLAPSTSDAAPRATAKRAAPARAPRVLPAPLPKEEVLPPLPAVGRDVTAITSVTSAPLPDWTSGGSSSSGGSGALPPLPPAPPAAAATSRPNVDVVATDSPSPTKATGFVLQLGTGALVPAQSFTAGMRTLGPGLSFELRTGFYATPHFGILVGVRGSYGHQLPGSGGSSDGYSLQAPVLLQFAAKDRTRGAYADIGLGFATTYAGSAASGALTYTLTSPVEMKLGLGYRFGASGERRSTAFDLNVGMDVGAVHKVEVDTADGKFSGDGDRPVHVVVALSALLHFSP